MLSTLSNSSNFFIIILDLANDSHNYAVLFIYLD